MKLTAFEYGKTEINEKMAFPDGNPEIKLPIALLFFMIEEKDKKILVDVGCDTMPGFPLYEFEKPAEIMKKGGVKPEDITHILLSHSHHDHIDALRYYKKAKVYIQENEKEAAKGYIDDASRLHTFKDQIKITDNIIMKHIGGHSPGSSIIILNGNYILCGDECYVKENFSDNIPTGSSYCIEKSREFIKEYRKDFYTKILFHDPDIVGELGNKVIFKD